MKLQGHELFALLSVFLSGGLEDYQKWEAAYPESIGKYGECPHCRGPQGLTLISQPPSGLDKAQL